MPRSVGHFSSGTSEFNPERNKVHPSFPVFFLICHDTLPQVYMVKKGMKYA
jgi:hypothetical protein